MSVLKLCCRTLSILPNSHIGNFTSHYSGKTFIRSYDNSSFGKSQILKVTICGAAGRVGYPLALTLKQSPFIDELALYDIQSTCAFATELAHIDTRCKVISYTGEDHIGAALHGSKIVIVIAAAHNSASLTHSAMFNLNAGIVQDLVEKIADHCPQAFLAIVTNPVNSLVPLASLVLKSKGVYNPKTVFGVTTINMVRANTFVSEVQGLEPECVFVPVIGGNSNETIVPLLSRAQPCTDFTNDEVEEITSRVQHAHEDMLKAKFKQGATLSCAFAIARFIVSLMKGLRQRCDIMECAYVKSSAHPELKYMSTPIRLGPGGIQRNFGIPQLSDYENCLLENAIPLLKKDIKKGEDFAKGIDGLNAKDTVTSKPLSKAKRFSTYPQP